MGVNRTSISYALREHLEQMNKAAIRRARRSWLRRICIWLLLLVSFLGGAYITCQVRF